jgi:RNA polymerase sigma factor (sigma-70 family)
MASTTLPTREQEQELHHRLLDGDKAAPADLAEAYYDALLQFLRRKNAKYISDDLLSDAAYETWSSLSKKPTSYDGNGSLWTYLRMSAQGDLRNALAKERRRLMCAENVEECSTNGKIRLADTEALAAQEEKVDRVRREIMPVVQAGLTDGELRCLELYLGGEHKTAPFADALGIAALPQAQREANVKRTKDKLKSRIKRARRDHDDIY